ncbi:hypothetical protein JW964_10590 [candidate division KSB1 bacterium]|nr:hypothetical protein [candidate division KSB1 bacterium]
MFIKIIKLICFYLIIQTLSGDELPASQYGTISQSKYRSLAMGGAFSAVQDNIAAIQYNPAAFSQYISPQKLKVTFYLNPVAPIVAGYEYQQKTGQEQNQLLQEFLKTVTLGIKGVIFSLNAVETGFIFLEEPIPLNSRAKFFSTKSFWSNYSNSFFFRLRLAPQVAIGVNTTLYHQDQTNQKKWHLGNSYGIFISPNPKTSVGVYYFALPDQLTNYREKLDRLGHDTINIGVAYHPETATTIALDVRNITQENATHAREVHIGLERNFGNWFALRSGWFQTTSRVRYYSGGIGLIADNLFKKSDAYLQNPYYLINYSLVVEESKSQTQNWHFFSFALRI